MYVRIPNVEIDETRTVLQVIVGEMAVRVKELGQTVSKRKKWMGSKITSSSSVDINEFSEYHRLMVPFGFFSLS